MHARFVNVEHLSRVGDVPARIPWHGSGAREERGNNLLHEGRQAFAELLELALLEAVRDAADPRDGEELRHLRAETTAARPEKNEFRQTTGEGDFWQRR